jgi:hypothetical protein
MTRQKWVQLISMLILAMLPVALQVRDWKFHDKRKNRYHSITCAILAFWFVSIVGLAWATWKDFSRPVKKVAYVFFLNKQRLHWGDAVALPLTNRVQDLEVSVFNDGDLPADGLMVTLGLPRPVPVVGANGWLPLGGFTMSSNAISERTYDKAYLTTSEHVITPGNFFTCPLFQVQGTNQEHNGFNILLVAESKNSDRQEVGTLVYFDTHIGEPVVDSHSYLWPTGAAHPIQPK